MDELDSSMAFVFSFPKERFCQISSLMNTDEDHYQLNLFLAAY